MSNIIWLTGNSGSGKTFLANEAKKKYPNVILLDGDEMRECISFGLGFSYEDRKENNLRIAKLAHVLSRQSTVIVSVIAPFKDVREEIDEVCFPFWVYVKRDLRERENYPYEPPELSDLVVQGSKEEMKESFLGFLGKEDFAKCESSKFVPPHGNA